MFDFHEYIYRVKGQGHVGVESSEVKREGLSYLEVLALVRESINKEYREELKGDISTLKAQNRYLGLIQEVLVSKNIHFDSSEKTSFDKSQKTELENFKSIGLSNLALRLYHSMARYDFLTPYIEIAQHNLQMAQHNLQMAQHNPWGFLPFLHEWEEINCNRWDDIEVVAGGRYKKLVQRFSGPEACVDIIKRMVLAGGVVIDQGNPRVDSYLGDSVRITATLPPCVDREAGAAFSIRRQKPITNSRDFFINTGTATSEELDFLCLCVNNGVSVAVAGATGAGKTTDINYLLRSLNTNKRLYTVEDTRELWALETNENGGYSSRVVHTVTKKNQDPLLRVGGEDLLRDALRYSPDVIGLGEARGPETRYSIEAGITGHTIVLGLHAQDPRGGYRRLLGLCMNGEVNMSEKIILENIVAAVPIMLIKKSYPGGDRRYAEIVEAQLTGDLLSTGIQLNTLYRYVVKGYERDENGRPIKVKGQHVKVNNISEDLANRLYANGVDLATLKIYAGKDFSPTQLSISEV